MFCPNCGSQNEDGANNCTNCGAPLDQGAQQTVNNGTVNSGATPKSKLVAGLLGIFLGGWGVHNFYLGYTKKGILQIVLTLVTCGVAALWGFIEGILILCGNINTDANGNRLAD